MSDEELKKPLIEQMGNRDNKEALQAVEQLRGWWWLQDRSLWGADLSDANLRNADLDDADLRGINLRGANLAIYDTLVIALAQHLNLPLITADQKQSRIAHEAGMTIKSLNDFQPSE